ncbi:hypothetical protein [Rhizobium ruizarguesonis]|uniref:hypothetical protein n=1 Tax=Rhizobium ruizarguesonis TaxID=2081791 RepID=UPI003716E3D1
MVASDGDATSGASEVAAGGGLGVDVLAPDPKTMPTIGSPTRIPTTTSAAVLSGRRRLVGSSEGATSITLFVPGVGSATARSRGRLPSVRQLSANVAVTPVRENSTSSLTPLSLWKWTDS